MPLNEKSIEDLAIELLKQQGYNYLYGPDIAPDGETPQRQSYADVLLIDRLREAVRRINPQIPAEAQEDAIKEIQRINSPNLIANNEKFHRLLTEGINVSYRKAGETRGDLVWLIDFKNPGNNDFLVINQFTVIENSNNKRPDIVIFVNGIPLIVMELKNPADENATLESAYRQLQTYKSTIPSLFTYNAFLVISDGLEAKAGTISSGWSRFMAWKSPDGKEIAPKNKSQLEVLIQGMLNKHTLIDLIRHFIVFEKSKKEDLKTGQIFVSAVKKLAAYHQYYAVNKAVESVIRASAVEKNILREEPGKYGLPDVKKQPKGDRKGGVIWHTQGSGKSLTMVFFTGKIVLAMNNPTIVVITDRNDLDDQLFNTFAASTQLLRQEPKQAESRKDLKEKLKVASGGIIFTTIQKFQPEEGNEFETLSERENIIVIVDEAHRTQYGFKGKVDKNTGNIKYGFAKYLRDALPNATYIGFTGTPIEKHDKNTPAVFGNYIDIYDIAQAVEDGATVPIYYESRLVKVNLSEKGQELLKELDKELEQANLSETQKVKAKWAQLEALVGSKSRLENIAKDIVNHFEERQKVFEGKAMIVVMSRRIAAELYEEIIKIRPKWHSDDLHKGVIKVVITSASSDGEKIAKHHTTKQQRRILAERMKDPDDELKIVIVRDMWLTGFDVPMLHTLYIDKPMKGHNLMQAIARVNRVYKDKPGGLVVDYLGIASDLKQALSFYADSGGKGEPAIEQEKAVNIMLDKLEIVEQMFFGFDYEKYFTANTSEKLSIILDAEEHILSLENGKKRFIDQVTALSKAYVLAVPHPKAMEVKHKVAFFQAVKSRLAKFNTTKKGKTNEQIETAIRQVIDEAIVSEKVVDIFDAAGIKKPDISILSEEFLLEVKNMKHKNLAIEVLQKILNDEIKARTKINLVKSKSFKEMLEEVIKKYHRKILTAAEVIDELIKLSKEIVSSDKQAKELGFTEFEYAFYTAVAENKSARELMGKDKLRELAIVLTQKVKDNTKIDWTIRENARANLRRIVKRTLRQYGYPPDMQKLATETVLKQAEMLANEIVNNKKIENR